MTGTLPATDHPPAPADMVDTTDPLGALRPWLDLLEERIRHTVAERRTTDPDLDDPHRGLFLTQDGAARVLAEAHPGGTPATPLVPLAPDSVLGGLATRFGLTALDIAFLVTALGPDLDPRLERLYGYLNDDLSRRRATVGLALDLYGLPATGPARFRFTADAPLVTGGLLRVDEPGRPLLGRTLSVPDPVTAHLLGHPAADPWLRGVATPVTDPPTVAGDRVLTAMRAGIDLLHLSGVDDGPGTAAGLLAAAGLSALAVDLRALVAAPQPWDTVAALLRTARLRGDAIVAGPLEVLEPEHPERARLLDELITRAGPDVATAVPVMLWGKGFWDPDWSHRHPLSLAAPVPGTAVREGHWRAALQRETGAAPDPALVAELATLNLGPDRVAAAAAAGVRLATVDDGAATLAHLRAGVRAQNGAGLARLARRITPAVGRDDLVLSGTTRQRLDELTLRARHRDTVLRRWRMRPGGGRGHGVTALFAGESGTGKTMSAEVLAAELGMDLYVVDLSTVVDKYVGQTEKNLERIFAEAAGVNGVLLFDEADAIFGKRSEVSDAHDRYANLESAYLLTRMESFDGIAVLTTNLRSNVDEAFTRRLDVITEFPMPEPAQRRRLWDACLGSELARDSGLDLDFCAERFELSGGSIRAAAVTAAYLAAESGAALRMTELVAAIAGEYRKLGRLVLDSEFGGWSPGR